MTHVDKSDFVYLTDGILDFNHVHEICDETEETVTLSGFFDGETGIRVFAGIDAQRIKMWLDHAHEAWIQYRIAKGETISIQDAKRELYKADLYIERTSGEDEEDIPF